ncbi:MAG: 2-oxoacid:acceptor oxidoreductase subunit alpha [Thaumarchaeota archaeon]|nr:2-oxoacid:acceptor oxidoreductase subunit alpha [Nitrososphaerota archaeon]
MKSEVVVRIAGAAGDGIASTGESFARIASRSGLHIFAYNSYQSVIRGGSVWLQVRAGDRKVYSQGDIVDFLIALNQDEVNRHAPLMSDVAGILYNSDRMKIPDGEVKPGVKLYPLPVKEMTAKYGSNPVMQNTVALGALTRMLDMNFDVVISVIKDTFGDKNKAIVDANIGVARGGYDYAGSKWGSADFKLKFDYAKRRPVMTGNQAIAMGAVAAGCKFYAAYPMTPASSILHWMAAHSDKCGVVVKQAEDEIAVLNMAIGAGFAGARAMCATSGGGFALMTEAVGLAGMTETPVVIVTSQRGGPSTGLPTKTEQGDLFQVFGASQGDFPKIIIAPSTVEDCYYATAEAFNLAEKYQLPVIIMSDLYLSEHMETISNINFKVAIDRGLMANNGGDGQQFKRYAFTETGVSPRSLPGMEGMIHVAASDEHDETGVLISDVFTDEELRVKIMNKRMRKMEFVLKELPAPTLYGPANADITLIGWGSTYSVLRETVETLAEDDITANHLQIRYLWPFHGDAVTKLLAKSKRILDVEGNYSGQLARLIRMETGVKIENKLLKYDGEPFYPNQVVKKAKELVTSG